MILPTRAELDDALRLVHCVIAPTPQIHWPILSQLCGAEVWVKHENHTPIGAFKVRGGLVYFDSLMRAGHPPDQVVTATRGNHGQSIAFAAARLHIKATIIVPHGNSFEKNAAMRAMGAELIEHGHDFQAAFEYASEFARRRGLHMVPSFHPLLVRGVATFGLELLGAHPQLDAVYVAIGLGSGACGMIAAREALGLATRIVGVVSANAPAYALSFDAGHAVTTESCDTIADGIACRVPEPSAVETINQHADRVVVVSDDEIKSAMRHYFTATHNLAEGAGAAALAGLLHERDKMRGKRVGVILSGGNIDLPVFREVLNEA